MRQKILFILLLITATVAGNRLSAQTFPVQAGLMLQPPFSVYLNDYTAVGSNRLALSLLLQDMSRADLPVRLRFHIEGQGFSLRTKDHYLPSPITLEPGIPLRLSGDELAGYLSPRNLQVVNGNEGAFLRTGKLPEGVYRFCVEVLEYNRNSVISNPACGTGWLLLNDPPLLNRPGQAEKLRAMEPQNIPFNWTPRHTGSPNSAFTTEYEFTLVEVWPANRNPNDAMLSTAPIYQVTTAMTSLHYGPAEPPLEPGRTYAWRVRAISSTGAEEMDLFKNSGYSEVHSFQWGEVCTAPQGLEVEQYGSTRLKLSWEASPEQSEFVVRYRLQGSEEGWEEENTYLNEHTIGSLQPDTRYEVQVVGLCASVTGGTSLTVVGKTAVDQNNDFSCGADPGEFNLDNTNPLPELKQGDYIQAGDLEVRIDSVGGSNGTFSGNGVTGLPFLNLIQVRVRFNDIRVNTDYRMFDGHIATIWDPNSRSVVDVGGDDVLEEGAGGNTAAGGETSNDFDGIDITQEGVIDSVYVNENGQIVVIDESGEEVQHEREPDTDTRITDTAGNVYVVDSEGNVTEGDSAGGSNGGNIPENTPNADSTQTDSLLIVQKQLIKEVLESFKEEISLWLENNGKGPLDEVMLVKLQAFPDCLPQDEEQLQKVLEKIDVYLEDPEELLNLIKEGDAYKAKIEELVAKLNGEQPPYKAGLSEQEWNQLVQMVCPYLIEGIDLIQYQMPLTAYVSDDYFLIDPRTTSFNDGDTIRVYNYMAGVTLYLKDVEGKEVTLAENNFPDIEGTLWYMGFTVDIEELEQDSIKTFKILVENVDTLQLSVVKEVITEDIKGAELEAFKNNANDGIDDGESWNPNGYACNNAVRAFLYYHKVDAILFPETHPDYPNSSYGSGLEGPDGPTVLKGDISWDGTADKMWDDFVGDGNDLTANFKEIEKNSSETWNNYFDRLQKEANKGIVIVGVVHSDNRLASRGHVVALMPKSLCSGEQRVLKNWKGETEVKLPCAIEAGGDDKAIVWFKQSQSEVDEYKWYKYEE